MTFIGLRALQWFFWLVLEYNRGRFWSKVCPRIIILLGLGKKMIEGWNGPVDYDLAGHMIRKNLGGEMLDNGLGIYLIEYDITIILLLKNGYCKRLVELKLIEPLLQNKYGDLLFYCGVIEDVIKNKAGHLLLVYGFGKRLIDAGFGKLLVEHGLGGVMLGFGLLLDITKNKELNEIFSKNIKFRQLAEKTMVYMFTTEICNTPQLKEKEFCNKSQLKESTKRK